MRADAVHVCWGKPECILLHRKGKWQVVGIQQASAKALGQGGVRVAHHWATAFKPMLDSRAEVSHQPTPCSPARSGLLAGAMEAAVQAGFQYKVLRGNSA